MSQTDWSLVGQLVLILLGVAAAALHNVALHNKTVATITAAIDGALKTINVTPQEIVQAVEQKAEVPAAAPTTPAQ